MASVPGLYILFYGDASRGCTPFAFKRAMCAQINLHVVAVWAVHSCAFCAYRWFSKDAGWSLRLYELVWVGGQGERLLATGLG